MTRHHKIEIIPAILPSDFREILEKADLVKGFTKTIQIDICDGHFVPSFTWPYIKHDDSYERMLHEEDGLPFWKELDYEFDLMVDHPEKIIEDWVMVGATRIVIHAEAKGDVVGAINARLVDADRSIVRFDDIKALLSQCESHHLPQPFFVVYDQNSFHRLPGVTQSSAAATSAL